MTRRAARRALARMALPWRAFVCIALAAIATGIGPSAAAQDPPPVTFDLSVGQSYGRGGPANYLDRNVVAYDVTLAWRARSVPGGGLLIGFSGGRQGSFGEDLSCVPLPGGAGCTPSYPRFQAIGALLGWEAGSPGRAAVRLMTGPTAYRAEMGRGDAFGIQARLDAATPAFHRLALVGTVRGDLLPSFHGDRHSLGSIALGIRVR